MMKIKLSDIVKYSDRDISLHQIISKEVIIQHKLRKFKSSLTPGPQSNHVGNTGPSRPASKTGKISLDRFGKYFKWGPKDQTRKRVFRILYV